ncbi:MAG: hypothetical protein IT371_15235 [Deltaproteobacteria bacterium]|nr:hypothetical protein [Deltaproteobacteria bacterium]
MPSMLASPGRRAWSGILLLLGAAACSRPRPGDPPPPAPRIVDGGGAWSAATVGLEAKATRAALEQPLSALRPRLGGHRTVAHSVLVARAPGSPERRVEQSVDLRVTSAGQFSAVKHTDPQYGQEVVFAGGWLYSRLRHHKFVRRKPTSAREPEAIADRLHGLLPAYLRLLRRFVELQPAGELTYLGRRARRVRLGLAAKPAAGEPEGGPATRWRKTIAVQELSGEALLDRDTGVPLRVKLAAVWSYVPPAVGPAPTGIPTRFAEGQAGRMTLAFEQRVSQIGNVSAVELPPAAEVAQLPPRLRLELERQMLVGERPVIPGWPKYYQPEEPRP